MEEIKGKKQVKKKLKGNQKWLGWFRKGEGFGTGQWVKEEKGRREKKRPMDDDRNGLSICGYIKEKVSVGRLSLLLSVFCAVCVFGWIWLVDEKEERVMRG